MDTEPSSPPIIVTRTRFPHILLITTPLVTLILGLLIGYWLGKNSLRPIEPAAWVQPPALISTFPSPTSTPDEWPHLTPTPIPPSTIPQIPGWLSYTNQTHHYTVQYPPGWTLDTSQADDQEDFQDSLCCDTAELSISNGSTKWSFRINQLYTGFEAPVECDFEQASCQTTYKNLTVLGYPLTRVLTRHLSTNTIVEAFIATPRPGSSYQHGFGQLGITTEYESPDRIKYFLDYEGPDVDQHLTTLDQITESLHPIK